MVDIFQSQIDRSSSITKQFARLARDEPIDPSEHKVLVVEDEADILHCCEDLLEGLGYNVYTAADGESAQQLIQQAEFDVVLLDLVLPGAMGFDLLDQVKERNPATAVIIVTGHANYDNAIQAIQGGASNFLSKPFTLDDLQIAVATALEKRRLAIRALVAEAEKESAKLQLFMTMRSLVATLEARDAYTRRHSDKVAKYSVQTAEEMLLPKEQLEHIYVGASLHDIGKVGVRDDVLRKAGGLTAEEYRAIQAHPEIGATIVQQADFPSEVVEAVVHHHERLGGQGYPHGLTDGDLTLSARIVAVADVYDAMTSERPYRPAHSQTEAIEELQSGAGTLYCKDVVGALVSSLSAKAGEAKLI